MGADLSQRLVPDQLWEPVAPLLPSFVVRPQDGGTAPCGERAVFTAVVYVLTSGCAWRHLPPTFGTSSATAHRRFTAWTEAGLWRRLRRAALDELGDRGEADWTSAIIDAASVRAKRGALTGMNPINRDKRGNNPHVVSDALGIPLAVAASGPNLPDGQAFRPLILAIPAIRSRRGPRRQRPVKIRGPIPPWHCIQYLVDFIASKGHSSGSRRRCRRSGPPLSLTFNAAGHSTC